MFGHKFCLNFSQRKLGDLMLTKRFLMFVLFSFFISSNLFSQKNFVTVKGDQFLDGEGKPILLKGINLGNWLNPEGYMFHFGEVSSARLINEVLCQLVGADDARNFWKTFRENYITKEDIHFIKSIGLNHIRVPFNFKLFVVEDHPDVFLKTGLEYLDKVITWCREEKLYVVLDMHAAPGGQTGANIDDSWSYPYLMENKEAQDLTIKLWKQIAKRYANEKIVIGYDLLNEPIAHYFENRNELNTHLEPLYKEITKAIRSVDKNHIIFLGGAQWNTNFSVFGKPFDGKLAYTFHKYWMPPVQEQVQEYIDFSKKYDVPIWLGESGENTDGWIDTFRIMLEKNNIGWCFWPYKKMDSPRGIASFARTAEWDSVIAYTQSDRKPYEYNMAKLPSRAVVKKAMADLLENIKFKNCKINDGYVKALGAAK